MEFSLAISLGLDADIVDRILTFLPDFSTLQATLIASQAINTTFKAHPNSIVRAVAYNVVGPTLPEALRLARCQSGCTYDNDALLEENVMTQAITPEEGHKLTVNAVVVRALEDLFSLKFKDRTANTSQLSSAESLRFQRAAYRIWLYSCAFGGDEALDEYIEGDDDARVQQAQQERQRFLESFNSQELLELDTAVAFLNFISGWTLKAVELELNSDKYSDCALAVGPSVILQCYQETCIDYLFTNHDIDDDIALLCDGFFSSSLDHIWDDRKIDRPSEGNLQSRIILDAVNGETDKCRRCDTVHGLNLWNETNWRLLKGTLPPNDVCRLLKGLLFSNPREATPIRQHLLNHSFSYDILLSEIFDIETTFSKTDWLCLNCVKCILRESLHLWWLGRKQAAGQTIPEDCWYGYNCRTMRHNMTHADKLNHLAEPTRGDS